MFVSTQADSDHIGANELIDSHANKVPANRIKIKILWKTVNVHAHANANASYCNYMVGLHECVQFA